MSKFMTGVFLSFALPLCLQCQPRNANNPDSANSLPASASSFTRTESATSSMWGACVTRRMLRFRLPPPNSTTF